MQKMKNADELIFIPADEWVRSLAAESAAFEVAQVLEPKSRRADSRHVKWDYVITLLTKPNNRPVELYVQTRTQLSPQTALAAFAKRQWVPPDGQIMLCDSWLVDRKNLPGYEPGRFAVIL